MPLLPIKRVVRSAPAAEAYSLPEGGVEAEWLWSALAEM